MAMIALMAMMKTMIAIKMINEGSDRVFERVSDRKNAKNGPKKVYPSLPKFTLVDDKSVLNALCPHKTAQEGPKRSPVEDYYCFLSTRGGFEGPSETRRHNRSSRLPPSCLGKTKVFGDSGDNWGTAGATSKVILYK